ncbi:MULTISPECIES: CDP-diacylglycerol--glycerol-3-phosphate 3-phosphatidyltransferase [Rathayibacter]|jgi:CDP-diacylglycerol--glycerol-3-phosphate 3-phosphatidyltransferase|uniref:CDP-diacylglycerol--glycerol-3-phosphate 3-phosphatidyltransferase n=2 Tax=Rathayibacter festucae TaxID=110937 RepID=A0A3Q9USN9_9MICO|nr:MULTISPECIES: CDP-diacylglycerol--glycerol-3-phosphate 3-phosphatidyltransferase [Rathayibacter]AZZ52305.1 CDP-diacylglycerol--glycerol-3-phosphate 3-phosphatidyltransferase [Rathayibacter festucae DSM 15932]MCJ1704714.1 CDP-diacylglycerol--glycerol-3-phosphate 3-phosphatidyltransferase [Rathayibacter sp. VKM Ac-2926]NQX15782.1 CDP-diacylglycerol--glycerol-3-phosphate 3-phosphatidyltransferase [Rathayibacter sp. VKM Ac-2857]QHC62327.1 CDP-diacylglycerol--glycerol-3-phosphate 3-phosphatidyltr
MTSPTAHADAAPSNWNLPNAITVVRILLAPVFFWLLLADNGEDGGVRIAAALLFIVAIATDGIDGHIARSRGLVTDLGKLLDPIADKVLTGAALVGLSILAELPWWVTIVILVREIGITVFRMAVLSDRVIPASRGGKLKTIVQSVAISLALLPLWTFLGEWVHWLNGITMTAAVVLTVVTGIDYLADAARQSRAARGRR